MDRPKSNKKHLREASSLDKYDDFVERITNKDLKPKKRPTEKQMFISKPKSKPKMSKKTKYGY
jgi:hypothetical protein